MDKKSQFAEIEEKILKLWDKEKTFQKSVDQRKGKPLFSFYDGPPYANGLPHHGHVVPVSIKDSVTRYKTMRGYYVPRRLGWDTHGLPVEYQIEKELGFKGKRDIVKYGIDKFNRACRESVFRYKKEWERFFERMGRWADAANAYATMDDTYIESIWWAFAEIYKQDLIHRDFRSTPYCPRCATPLSNFELNQGYKDNIIDPSVFVKFPVVGESSQVIAWTTTPWTLPGNAALAVDSQAEYSEISYVNDEGAKEQLIVATKRLEIIDGKYRVLRKFKGKELVGKRYRPLFELDPNQFDVDNPNLYKIWPAEFVSLEDGTGIVHIAPAFGEDDLKHGQSHKIPILQTIDEYGQVKPGIGLPELDGQWFKKADQLIIKHLTQAGRVFAAETISHTYPFCWRCETPLLYYAVQTWFMDVPKLKTQLLNNNQKINWVPKHIKDGRFGKWLEEVQVWNLSRNRFWGAPLPIWTNVDNDRDVIVISSIDELKKLSGIKTLSDLHRPQIDKVEIKKGDKTYRRVEEVFDVWFEAGSMPYAQEHYPFENKPAFASNFPADFIAESIDQTRGWFYTLLVLATALFNKPAAKNTVVSGWVVAADGQKLSKRLKNYLPIDDVFNIYGADTLRFFMLTSPVASGEDVRFSSDVLKEVHRNLFMTLWNVFGFFKTYAEVDKWRPPVKLTEPRTSNVLDRWMLARLNQTIAEVTEQADKYQISRATRPLTDLIDDLSNWYVRRSRRRFWKSENDQDKKQAYATLHYVLVRTCQLLAPWAPFLTDYIYRELKPKSMPQSVHLTDWPKPIDIKFDLDDNVLYDMSVVRELITKGLKQRANAGIKVRQPLAKATVATTEPRKNDNLASNQEMIKIIADELNVKKVVFDTSQPREELRVDINLTHELRLEGMAREVIRQVQQYRKELDLKVDDRIKLYVETKNGELKEAIQAFEDLIKTETLAKDLELEIPKGKKSKTVKIEDKELKIAIAK